MTHSYEVTCASAGRLLNLYVKSIWPMKWLVFISSETSKQILRTESDGIKSNDFTPYVNSSLKLNSHTTDICLCCRWNMAVKQRKARFIAETSIRKVGRRQPSHHESGRSLGRTSFHPFYVKEHQVFLKTSNEHLLTSFSSSHLLNMNQKQRWKPGFKGLLNVWSL